MQTTPLEKLDASLVAAIAQHRAAHGGALPDPAAVADLILARHVDGAEDDVLLGAARHYFHERARALITGA